MERLNKITLREELGKPVKVRPVVLSARANGTFGMSTALYNVMNRPEYIEFIARSGELFIMPSDPQTGFKVTANARGRHFTFSCRPISKRFFKGAKQVAVVFTEPVEVEIDGLFASMYQIKL